MSILSAREITKAYGAQELLAGVSLTVEPRERVGLLGPNGTGKSTLLRILTGVETPDSGVLERGRENRILYLPQEPELDARRTPRELVEEGLTAWKSAVVRYGEISTQLEHEQTPALLAEQAELAERIERLGGWSRGHVVDRVLGDLGVGDVDRAVGSMSGGEQRRVALARMLVAEPDLAILDEPTNHLDADTIEWLEGYLVESFRGAVLLVTHDRYVLDAICDRICELDAGKLREYRGNYGDYLEQKAELEAHAERVESNRANLLRREREWLLRGAKARSTKQKARIDRAQALIATPALKQREKLALDEFAEGAGRTGKTILDLTDLSLSLGNKLLIRDLTVRLVPGQRLGIIGKNGVGKTSLLKLVTGELQPTSGQLVLGKQSRVALFDQTRSNLRDDWSIFDNVAEREGAERTQGGSVRIGEQNYELRSYLERFSFRAVRQRQKVGALSGGERARVALAKALCTGANLLLLDEPTNDLDISTLSALEELLESWPGCALVVSHDRYFLDRVATSILAFEGEGRVLQYPGGYASYRSLREQAEAAKAGAEVASARAAVERRAASLEAASEPARKPLTYAERRELDGLFERISAAEARAAELEAKLADPKLYADPSRAKQAQVSYEQARAEVATLTQRWEELEARR